VVAELTRRGVELNDSTGTTNDGRQRRSELIDLEGNRIGLVEVD
jgi:hypothetical protein